MTADDRLVPASHVAELIASAKLERDNAIDDVSEATALKKCVFPLL
jgi:hypothetical protein